MQKYKQLQETILEYLNEGEYNEENYQNFVDLLNNLNIKKDQNEFRLFLHLINNISNYHYRSNNFLSKIERILLLVKKEFVNFLSNEDIFVIFKNNKRILLSLFENDIIFIDQFCKDYMAEFQEENYPIFFQDKINSEQTNDINFIINQRNGENEQIFCKLIRDDKISDFIIYVNQNDFNLNTTIKPSVFETNPFLMDKNPTLIEYAAFYGSYQIFTYLYKNNVKLTPSLWLYSIHGSNPQIINFLETNKIKPEKNSYLECLKEAIKCHHNEIVTYINENLIQDEIENINELIELESIIYYNYAFFPNDLFNRKNFYYFCKFDYYPLVENYLKNRDIDINFKVSDKIDDFSYIITPFLISVQRNNFNIVELLLKQPKIDVNFMASCCKWSNIDERLNAIIFAIINDNDKMIKLLLMSSKIDVNTPIMIKTKKENGDLKVDEYYPLHEAIIHDNAKIIKLLLSNKSIDVNVKQRIYKKLNNQKVSTKKITVLQKAIMNSNIDIIKLLINHPNIEINKISTFNITNSKIRKITSLFDAVKNKEFEITKLLLENPNIDVNKYVTIIISKKTIYKTPLIMAIDNNDLKTVELLLNHQNIDVNISMIVKVNNNEKTYSPLFLSIKNKNDKIVKLLLSHPKIDVNQISIKKNNNNITQILPLTLAIQLSNADIVSLLLSNKNIDVNLKFIDNSKKIKGNPLGLATYLGHKEIIELLLIHKNIDVNAKYKIENSINEIYEKNSLIMAVEKNYVDIEKLLLCHPDINVNVYLNIRNKINSEVKQIPLLHLAISQKNIDLVKNILDNQNIDVNAKSSIKRRDFSFIDEIETPTLYHAVDKNNLEIIQLLLLNKDLDVNSKYTKTHFKCDCFFINKKSPLQLATINNNWLVFKYLFNYLRKNKKLEDNLHNLMEMTNDNRIKSLIYDEINKQS